MQSAVFAELERRTAARERACRRALELTPLERVHRLTLVDGEWPACVTDAGLAAARRAEAEAHWRFPS